MEKEKEKNERKKREGRSVCRDVKRWKEIERSN